MSRFKTSSRGPEHEAGEALHPVRAERRRQGNASRARPEGRGGPDLLHFLHDPQPATGGAGRRRVSLRLRVQGAKQVRSRLPDAISIFVAPPSLEELERRLRNRQTESDDELRHRLANAEMEMEQEGTYDRILVNDDLDDASAELRRLILSYRE